MEIQNIAVNHIRKGQTMHSFPNIFVLKLELVRLLGILNSIKESKKSTFSDNEKHIKIYTFYYIEIVFLMTYSESAKTIKENKNI